MIEGGRFRMAESSLTKSNRGRMFYTSNRGRMFYNSGDRPSGSTKRACFAAIAVAVSAHFGCNALPTLPIEKYVPAFRPSTFVNWETPHVSPLTLSSDGNTLLAVNTPAAQLEVFEVSSETPRHVASIPVGLDPVSVRFRDINSAWVVNHISDSISIIDLMAQNVVRTLQCDDEPTDVVFAGNRAFVTCSQVNELMVFDLADLDAEPRRIAIQGEDPRALSVSPDGRSVYAAIFESGNHTTLVPWESVSDESGPHAGVNPPPNAGFDFSPAFNAALPAPPPTSLIVRKEVATGAWLDDIGGDWQSFVSWDQHDHDLAIIDTDSLAVRYIAGLMNANMQLAVLSDGRVAVVGTDATNGIRYEPNLTGKFVHSVIAVIDPQNPGEPAIRDLNPHLANAYSTGQSRVSSDLRSRSIADPRGVVFAADGARGFVTGLGSNNVIAIDAAGNRIAEAQVGQGPTGIALDESRNRLFVLNRFDASVSVVSAATLATSATIAFFDPTPAEIRAGRPFLYDAHRTSGLGVTACAACHIDGRTDQLAWDLGDPSGAMKTLNQECNRPFLDLPVGPCEDFHPMKGPMTTQTLQNIIGSEPLHWRGDRESIEAFNPAFQLLLGNDRQLFPEEMTAFGDLLASIKFPPNPNRNIDNTLKVRVGNGRPQFGETMFFNKGIDLQFVKCADCHNAEEIGAGTNRTITPRNLLVNPNQSIKVPQIRNIYEKAGFSRQSQQNNLGFGFNHDGTIDGLENFFHIENFTGFAEGPIGEQQRRDMIAFVMSFSTDTHPGVGVQVTLDGTNDASPPIRQRLNTMRRLADDGVVGLIARGKFANQQRGFAYVGNGLFAPDRISDSQIDWNQLIAQAAIGAELTLTLVPLGMDTAIGIDRNQNGISDGDE